MKMVQGFQADFCISPPDLTGLSQPQQPQQPQPQPQSQPQPRPQPQQQQQQPQPQSLPQQQLAVVGQTAQSGSVPGVPNGHAQSPPRPPSNAENFPALGAPHSLPPSAFGAAATSVPASQKEEGSADGRRASTDISGDGEGAGQGRGVEVVGMGPGRKQKKAGKTKGTATGEVTAAAAAPRFRRALHHNSSTDRSSGRGGSSSRPGQFHGSFRGCNRGFKVRSHWDRTGAGHRH